MTNKPDYRRATNLAYRVLLRHQVTRLPVDVFGIIRALPKVKLKSYVQVTYEGDCSLAQLLALEVSDHGFSAVRGGRAIIVYNDAQDRRTIRFTVAHELGHLFLGHTQDGKVEDIEANCFARNLLCPIPVVRSLGIKDIERYCDLFDVTPAAAETSIWYAGADTWNISDINQSAVTRAFSNFTAAYATGFYYGIG